MERLSDYQKAQKWLESIDWDDCPESDDNLATICEALQYKDLEEQGKLLKLPVAVGDAVWKIKNGEISKWVVSTIKIEESGVSFCNAFYICDLNDFGKTGFLTKEAAEAALKEMSE